MSGFWVKALINTNFMPLYSQAGAINLMWTTLKVILQCFTLKVVQVSQALNTLKLFKWELHLRFTTVVSLNIKTVHNLVIVFPAMALRFSPTSRHLPWSWSIKALVLTLLQRIRLQVSRLESFSMPLRPELKTQMATPLTRREAAWLWL